MNLFDLAVGGANTAAGTGWSMVAGSDESTRLHGLLAQMGAEIAGPLTAAVERINALTSTGRIDRESLRQLRDEVQAARQAGMIGQQLTRFALGRIRQSHERLQLAEAVEHVLAHRQRETRARGVTLTLSLAPVEVVCDASLLSNLLDSTVDWAVAQAASQVEFTIELHPWPAAARLSCRFDEKPGDATAIGTTTQAHASNDSLTWHLLDQTARAMGLRLERRSVGAGEVHLSIDFPRTVKAELNDERAWGATEYGSDDGFAASANSQPLAGSHVLVIASRREMRVALRDALREMSLIIDFVNSVDEAAAFCREGLPHAIIIEAIQCGERFGQFRQEIRAEIAGFVFIEIVEEGKVFEMSGAGGSSITRVGREVLASSLPSALMFELSKGL